MAQENKLENHEPCDDKNSAKHRNWLIYEDESELEKNPLKRLYYFGNSLSMQ